MVLPILSARILKLLNISLRLRNDYLSQFSFFIMELNMLSRVTSDLLSVNITTHTKYVTDGYRLNLICDTMFLKNQKSKNLRSQTVLYCPIIVLFSSLTSKSIANTAYPSCEQLTACHLLTKFIISGRYWATCVLFRLNLAMPSQNFIFSPKV